LLAGVGVVVLALAVSLVTAGRLGGWPLAVTAVGVLPFLLMAWGAERASGSRRRARTIVLSLGALWVTGCLAAVFLLAGREPAWTLLGLPAQLAVLLLLLGVAPLLLLGLGHAAIFEDEPPPAVGASGSPHGRPVGGGAGPAAGGSANGGRRG
jgi:hypothetical protein